MAPVVHMRTRGAEPGIDPLPCPPSAVSQPTALLTLGILSSIALLGSYDRYLVGILVEHLKRDLQIGDSAVGLLTGLGFALVYAVMSVPIARLSDRGHRVPVLAGSVVLWTAMTACCGLAPGFAMLLMARLGVGLGEAGCIPTTRAIISEYFSERWRATALAATVIATGIGVTLANVCGGWLADVVGWRWAFFAGALPGPFLAWLLWTHVPEPPRRKANAVAEMAIGSALGCLLRIRALVLLCAGVALCSIATYASMAWFPAFLMRRYDLTAASVGSSYGAVMGISMIAAILAGAILCDYLSRRDHRWPMWLLAGGYLLALPLTLGFLVADTLASSLIIAGADDAGRLSGFKRRLCRGAGACGAWAASNGGRHVSPVHEPGGRGSGSASGRIAQRSARQSAW